MFFSMKITSSLTRWRLKRSKKNPNLCCLVWIQNRTKIGYSILSVWIARLDVDEIDSRTWRRSHISGHERADVKMGHQRRENPSHVAHSGR